MAKLCNRCWTALRVEGSQFCLTCKNLCSKCKINPRAPHHRWCRSCNNAATKKWRETAEQTDEARLRSNCRAYANVYKRRGKLIPQPCEVCASTENIQMHHDDYSKPLEVRWLCDRHNSYRRHPL